MNNGEAKLGHTDLSCSMLEGSTRCNRYYFIKINLKRWNENQPEEFITTGQEENTVGKYFYWLSKMIRQLY